MTEELKQKLINYIQGYTNDLVSQVNWVDLDEDGQGRPAVEIHYVTEYGTCLHWIDSDIESLLEFLVSD